MALPLKTLYNNAAMIIEDTPPRMPPAPYPSTDKIDFSTDKVLTSAAEVSAHYRVPSVKLPPSIDAEASLLTLPDVRICSKPAAVYGPDRALLWAYSPQLKRSPANCDVINKPASTPKPLSGSSLFAAVDGFSYYHWLLGTLPKLLLTKKLLGQEFWARFSHIFVNARHKGQVNFQTESLELLGIPLEKVVWVKRNRDFLCEQVSLPTDPGYQDQTQLHAWALDLLRQTFLAQSTGSSNPLPERFYISRAHTRRRRLQNEGELVHQLAKQGIHSLDLNGMPFLEQVALFSQATEVIGLHGAGLANIVFCRPGTRVLEISPSSCRNPCFAQLAQLAQLEYRSFTALSIDPEQAEASDAVVDCAQLCSYLRNGD